MEKTKETMASYSIRLPSELYDRIMDATTRLDLRSKNDFVRDACEFYLEWLNRESTEKFVTPALESVVRGTVRDSESRIVRQLFRLAVEMNVHNHLLAEYDGIGDYDFEKLRISAVNEVKETNGTVRLADIVQDY